jgi:hypothetical protein
MCRTNFERKKKRKKKKKNNNNNKKRSKHNMSPSLGDIIMMYVEMYFGMESGVLRMGPQHPLAFLRRQTIRDDMLVVCCDPWWLRLGHWWLQHTTLALTRRGERVK